MLFDIVSAYFVHNSIQFIMSEDMSTAESSDDEPYEPAIAPLAPKVILQEEGQVEVSASPAFQCLDEVCLPRASDNLQNDVY